MSDETNITKPRRRRRLRLWLPVLFTLVVLIVAGVYTLISERRIYAPDWMRAQIEHSLSRGLAGGQLRMDALSIELAAGGAPVIVMQNVTLMDQSDLPVASFDFVDIGVTLKNILTVGVAPTTLHVSGAALSLRREPDGRLDLALDMEAMEDDAGSVSELMEGIEGFLSSPLLSGLETIVMDNVLFEYEDVRAARYWIARGGTARLTQSDNTVSLGLRFDLLYGTDTPARVRFDILSYKDSAQAVLAAEVDDLPASDFATQAPAVAWLSVIRAPVSGAMRTHIQPDGRVGDVSATLDIGRGALQPLSDLDPVPFTRGRVDLTYDQAAREIRFENISVQSDTLTLEAEGTSLLRDFQQDWPETMLGQFRLSRMASNPADAFETPVTFANGVVDMRLRLNPFQVDLGQVTLTRGDTHLRASGQVAATPRGWTTALDFSTAELGIDELLALWPTAWVPNTRDWVLNNLNGGVMTDLNAVVRLTPDTEPVLAASTSFADLDVTFMRAMPPVQGASGHAAILDNRLSLMTTSGHVSVPGAGDVDVSGSHLEIPDLQAQITQMVVDLTANARLRDALTLLDREPLQIMSRMNRTPAIADGQAEIKARIALDLLKQIELEDVTYDVNAVLRDVTSDQIVDGHEGQADELTLMADSERVEITGSGRISGVPFDIRWRQPMGPGQVATLDGTIALSQVFADRFRLGLPADMFTGQAVGTLHMDLPQGRAPRFELTSDLNRLGIRIAPLGWRKRENETGAFEVSGTLGQPARIEALRLSAPGLTADGTVRLNDDGSFAEAAFTRVAAGAWLDAAVTLRPDRTIITSGTLDLRHMNRGGGGGARVIDLTLDQLHVSDDLSLTNVSGTVSGGQTLRGDFSGALNGMAQIRGTLTPSEHGAAITLQSDNGGGVLQSLGLLGNARGGALTATLVPRAQEGSYDGQARIEGRVNVYDAPALAGLLGAISVIGLLEQMAGDGLVFNNLQSRFRINPGQIVVQQGSAVGPSLGLSIDGYMDTLTDTLDMQGVISPIYVVNGVGALISRRGEGLVGFNFRLDGPASSPRISVNPLSVLTPGIFREIFRRPPPVLPE